MDAHGRPEIFNTDQGSQFTGHFTGALADATPHLDGRSRTLDGQRVRELAVALAQIRGLCS